MTVINSRLSKRLLLELKEFNQQQEVEVIEEVIEKESSLSLSKSNSSSSHLKLLKLESDSNLLLWKSLLKGPEESIFNHHDYELNIIIPLDYPLKPPLIKFNPFLIFHPNINFKTGEICLDILKENWSPIWTISTSCLGIQTLLAYPESSSPLNVDAANLLRCGDNLGYESLARMYIELGEER